MTERERGQWRDKGGLVHAYVALKTAANWYHVGTVCLTYEDMYMRELPSEDAMVTCITCLVDPKGLTR